MTDAPWAFAPVRDGVQLRYRLWPNTGEGTRARILLLHPLAMDAGFWDGVATHLTAVADVLAVDVRGHGQSRGPNSGSLEQQTRDLEDLLDIVGWDAAFVAGASMGGCIAIALAGAAPQRISGLGLVDTTDWYGPDAPAAWESRAERARQSGLVSLLDFQLTRWFSDDFRVSDSPHIVKAVATFLANDVDCYVEACRMLGKFDERSILERLRCPARIIVGAEDYATPPDMARGMQSRLPGSQLAILAGVRHFTPLEVPELVAAQLRGLFDAA